MKQISTVSLLCGTAIILAPIVQNLLMLAMVAHLLALNPSGNYHLNGMLSESYQNWCLCLGLGLLVNGGFFGWQLRHPSAETGSSTRELASLEEGHA